jgi:uncharacterized membrane protein
MFTDDKKLNLILGLTYSAYLLLFVVITLDSLKIEENFWGLWLLQVLPLVMLLPGLALKYYRSYSWLCFLMLAYFTSAVIQVYSSTRDPHDWLGLVLTVILFVTAMLASRWLQRRVSSS